MDIGPVSHGTSLALDSSNNPHISYVSSTEMKYAHWTGSAWDIQTVDNVGNIGGYPSLALDGTDNPSISYYYGSIFVTVDLKYAIWSGSTWDIQVVDTSLGDSLGHWDETTLALDSYDNPHIGYRDSGISAGLKYAYWTGSAWDIQMLESGGGAGRYPSLALGSTDRPHLSYHAGSDLKYARWAGTAWDIQIVDSGKWLEYSSLALDNAGNTHISYYDKTNGDLKYASTYSVDIGFRPNPDGYHFHNYGGVEYDDYTIEDMRLMFGDDAVCQMDDATCYIRPTASEWYEEVHQYMAGGRCDGFTTTSLRFFKALDNQSDFQSGANTTYDLQLGNARRHISYYWVLQVPDPVATARGQALQETPIQVLNKLQSAMSNGVPDPTTLIIYNTAHTSGHSVTPYAVDDQGNGVYRVRVYDNNSPDDDSRYVEINTNNNTWNSNLIPAPGTWSGDANTYSLGVIPISIYAQQPICPWCSGASGSTSVQVWLAGQGHLLITDSLGGRIGYINDQYVDEIPGAFGSVPPGGLGIPAEPIYTLPITDTYTIVLDGETLTQTENVSVTQFGPESSVWVENVSLEPSTQDELAFASDGTQLVYQASNGKEVTLALVLDNISESNQFQIQGADVGTSQIVTLKAKIADGQIMFSNAQASGGQYDLAIERVSSAGEQSFMHRGIAISATDTHYIDYGTWDGIGSITLYIDEGSDGTLNETLELENQAWQLFLPLIQK